MAEESIDTLIATRGFHTAGIEADQAAVFSV